MQKICKTPYIRRTNKTQQLKSFYIATTNCAHSTICANWGGLVVARDNTTESEKINGLAINEQNFVFLPSQESSM